MPLYFFYTMVQKRPKTQIKGGGGGPALTSTEHSKIACCWNFYELNIWKVTAFFQL